MGMYGAVTARGRRRRRAPASLGRRRWGTLAAAGLVVAAAAGWMGVRGVLAQREAGAVRAAVPALERALAGGDAPGARAALGRLQAHAARAHRLTDDLVWRAAGALPWAGDTPRAITRSAVALDTVARSVIAPLVDVGTALTPDRLRAGGDRIALQPISDAAAVLGRATTAADAVRAELADIDGLHVPAPLARGRLQFVHELDRLAATTGSAARAARLLPPMLGADGARRYFVALQNPAEARGTGGIIGGFAIVEADRGRVRVVRQGSNKQLTGHGFPVDLGPEHQALYGANLPVYANANLGPHFPDAARQWAAMWTRQSGQQVDGVLATDPVALGYVLSVTGPVQLPDGTRVTGASAADYAMRGIYARYPLPAQDPQRDAVLQALARASFGRLLSARGNLRGLVAALGRAAAERRLQIWSAHPAEERALAGTPVAGELPDTWGPFAALVVDNAGGNKLDYYLDRSLTYRADACPGAGATVTVGLRNAAAAAGLPAYVTLQVPHVPSYRRTPLGTSRSVVAIYGPAGASVDTVSVGGRSVGFLPAAERGHPVAVLQVVLMPGERRELAVRFVGASTRAQGGTGHTSWTVIQPLVRPQASRLLGSSCDAK